MIFVILNTFEFLLPMRQHIGNALEVDGTKLEVRLGVTHVATRQRRYQLLAEDMGMDLMLFQSFSFKCSYTLT